MERPLVSPGPGLRGKGVGVAGRVLRLAFQSSSTYTEASPAIAAPSSSNGDWSESDSGSGRIEDDGGGDDAPTTTFSEEALENLSCSPSHEKDSVGTSGSKALALRLSIGLHRRFSEMTLQAAALQAVFN